MIKMFVMKTCPYCEYVEKQVAGDNRFQVIDISTHVHKLAEFLKLRDNNPAFEEVRRTGDVGVPCYVKEDGTVTLSSADVGLDRCPKALPVVLTARAANVMDRLFRARRIVLATWNERPFCFQTI